jgi:hypothetical protein
MMGENNIGPIFMELQQAADQSLSEPISLGAGRDKFGLGFQIASSDPKYVKFRSGDQRESPLSQLLDRTTPGLLVIRRERIRATTREAIVLPTGDFANRRRREGLRDKLSQPRVLGLGLLQDGDFGVRVFPESKEILICRLGFDGVAL